MRIARRLYVYLLSGIGLAVLASGLTLLVSVLLDALGLRGGEVFGGGEVIRERLTLASAMTAVSLPVWLVHWYFAERSVRPDHPEAQVERDSAIRGLYLALVLGGLLIAGASSAIALIETAVLAIAGSRDVAYNDVAGSLALLLVASAMWAYHVWLRIRDWRRGPLTGAGAWLPRTYLYAAAFGGLLLLLFGIVGLIQVVGRTILDSEVAFTTDGGSWWAAPLAVAAAQVITGGALWIGHLWYATTLLADPGWRGRSERPALLRLAYFVVAIVASSIAVVAYLGDGARQALAAVLDVSDVTGGSMTAAVILLPLLSAIPFGAAWWTHARWLRDEATLGDDADRFRTVDRLDDYAIWLVGLGFGAVAVGWLGGLLIDVVLGGGRTVSGAGYWQRELAQYVPYALLGNGLWLWRWARVERRHAASPALEAASTSRRTSLLIVLAVAILSGVASFGVILYRAFGTIFGVALGGNAVSELSRPVGALLTAVAVAAYFGLALRRDQQLRAHEGTPGEAPRLAQPAPVSIGVVLRLSGPAEADLPATIEGLRAQLPEGYVLDQIGPTTRG